jgi:hypothetical protein
MVVSGFSREKYQGRNAHFTNSILTIQMLRKNVNTPI